MQMKLDNRALTLVLQRIIGVALDETKHKKSYYALAKSIIEHGIESTDKEDFKLKEESNLATQIRRIHKGDVKEVKKQKSLIFLNNYFKEFLFEYYEKIYEEVYMENEYPEVIAIQKLFGDNSGMRSKDIAGITGKYLLYRSFYLDPENYFMTCLLSIGDNSSPYEMSLKYSYDGAPWGYPSRPYTLTGTLAPLRNGQRFAGVLRADQPDSNTIVASQLFRIDAFVGASDHEVHQLNGVAVSSVGSKPSNAWSYVATRINDEQGQELPLGNYRKDERELQEYIQRQLRRGFITHEIPS